MMFGWIFGIILLIVLIIAIGRSGLLRRNPGTPTGGTSPGSALETLKNRYAKGEIDTEEYERRKAELQK